LFISSAAFCAGNRELAGETPDDRLENPSPSADENYQDQRGVQLSFIGHGSDFNRKRRCEGYSKTLRGSFLVHHAAA